MKLNMFSKLIKKKELILFEEHKGMWRGVKLI
jgi:hypothetical protein